MCILTTLLKYVATVHSVISSSNVEYVLSLPAKEKEEEGKKMGEERNLYGTTEKEQSLGSLY